MSSRATRRINGVGAFAAAFALVAALSSASHADAIIASSLGLSEGGVAGIHDNGFAAAQLFVTDNHRYELTSLFARVGNQDGTPLAFAQIRAHDAAANAPVSGADFRNNYLTTFALPDLTGTVSDRLFTPNTRLILEPNTSYWFVLGSLSDSTTNYDWAFSLFGGPIVGPGTIPSRFAETRDEGKSWTGSDGTPYLLEVRGVQLVAPEPSALCLLAVAGLPALGLMTRPNTPKRC